MCDRRRSFLIRDILADVNIDERESHDDEPKTTTTSYLSDPSEFSDRGIGPAVTYLPFNIFIRHNKNGRQIRFKEIDTQNKHKQYKQ